MKQNPPEKVAPPLIRFTVYHRYFRSSGFYRFLLSSLFKLAVIVGLIVLLFIGIQQFIVTDLKQLFFTHTDKVPDTIIWLIFALSESLLGLIPPDLFIVWGMNSKFPLLTVAILSVISYLGGFISYFIGRAIMYHPRLKTFLNRKYEKLANFLKRWGGFFILIAAIFPVPYSMATMLAGMVDYKIERLALFGIARIVRFFLYAAIIMGVI